MKNKKMLYLLIPATLIVWSLIIYKIISNLRPEEASVSQHRAISTPAIESTSDTFSIHPSYRDPFLGKIVAKSGFSHGPAKTRIPVNPVVKAPLVWPAIVYGGIIKNQKLNKEMILLQIDGQDFMTKVGETTNGIKLFKVHRDSIEVHFSKEKKIIHK
jgi:hypothetical protein